MTPAELREQLYRHGFAPLPLNGKRPPMEEWTKKGGAGSEEIKSWSVSYPHCVNTGILTASVPALDIDIMDEEAAASVEHLAREHFGERGKFLVRIGQAPKRAIPFTTTTPFKKITLNVTAPNGTKGKIEVLADGQQIAVHGEHPDVHTPYRWFGGELWEVSVSELPHVGEAEMRAFVTSAGAMLEDEHGYKIAGKAEQKNAGDSADEGGAEGKSWGDCVNSILEGEALHDSIVVLAAKLASAGTAATAAIGFLRALLGASRAPKDERWRQRYDSIPRAVHSARAKFAQAAGDEAAELQWYGKETATAARLWLVDGMLPETGLGLISGQWGTYKTFVAIDLAAEVMVGLQFIGAPVARRGGVLFLAAEGAGEIPIRLRAVLQAKHAHSERVPFAWAAGCPALIDAKSAQALAAIAHKAHMQMLAEFDLPLALIIIDTIGTAAGYAKNGDENDAAIAQGIMGRLAALARDTGTLVLGIDHFGKAVETGTRGSSAKEAAADVVLALLGDRAISGSVSNTRLAVRKLRAGASGSEYPFGVRPAEVETANGETAGSLVVDWGAGVSAPKAADDWGRGKSLKLLRRIIMSLLVDLGTEIRPWADGPVVRGLAVEAVRAEFFKQAFAEGDPKAKQHTRRMAFARAMEAANDRGLIAVREVSGTEYVWLCRE